MTTTPADMRLESAMRKLREGVATAGQGLVSPRIHADECAALLTRLEAADAALTELASPEFVRNYEAMKARLEAAEQTMTCISVVNRIEPLPPVVMQFIAQYHNTAPATEEGS